MKTVILLLSGLLALPLAGAGQDVSGALLVERLRASYDRANGGFEAGPKVVQPLQVSFLLREAARGNRDAREMAISTLLQMARAAIHDQVGGGFHHQSLDPGWRVPRLDKKLEDQALLVIAYTEAWQLTGEEAFQRVARRTLDYVLRDLRAKNGGFYDGHGPQSLAPIGGGPKVVVGRVYGWELSEVRHLLGKQADLPVYYYGIKESGNIAEAFDVDGNLKGLNLLSAVRSDAETRAKFGLTQQELVAALDTALAKLQLIRSHRPPPSRDGTIGTMANALMVSALARAGAAFDEPRYMYEAGQSLRFLDSSVYDRKSGSVLHAGGAREPGTVEDYAAVVQAVLDVYEISFNPRWLKLAIELQQQQDQLFWNGTTLRYTAAAGQDIDSSVPGAASLSADNLLRLAAITGSRPWQTRAEGIFRSHYEEMIASPQQLPGLISVASANRVKVIVVIGDAASDEAKALLRVARSSFEPPRTFLLSDGKGTADPLAAYAPMLAKLKATDMTAATVCEDQLCRTPTTDPQKLAAYLSP